MNAHKEQTIKLIRNITENFNVYGIITKILMILNQRDADEIEYMRKYTPWNLLLMLKWIFQYGDFKNSQLKPDPTVDAFRSIFIQIHLIPQHIIRPTEYSDILLWMRSIAHQQFWYQSKIDQLDIAEQYYMFDNLEPKHRINTQFQSSTGIQINEFLELSFALILWIQIAKHDAITPEVFQNLSQSYPPKTIQHFLDSISININDVKQELSHEQYGYYNDNYHLEIEYYEKTPFFRFPLIKKNDLYFYVSKQLLQSSLASFVYGVARSNNSQIFMSKFGVMFEKTVLDTISQKYSIFIKEHDLQEIFDEKNKLVDAIIVENDCNMILPHESGHKSCLSDRLFILLRAKIPKSRMSS